MSTRRGRRSRSFPLPQDPARDLALWWRAVALREEWFGHALSTAPADRPAAETAITALYALLGEPPPSFVWADSPSAASQLLPPLNSFSSQGIQPLESRLASLVSSLRERLDRRIGGGRDLPNPWSELPLDPLTALRSGRPLKSVLASGVGGALRRGVREPVTGLLRAAIPERSGLVWYGQHEADWVAHYEVHHQLLDLGFGAESLAQLDLWATIVRSCGWWWPRDGVCVLSERPSVLRTESTPGSENGEIRLHHEHGPALAYPDGWAVHSWHGTPVPSWVIDDPTAERIAAERNIEVRRCAIERLGWQAFITNAGLSLVGQAADPGNPGSELRLYDLPYTNRGRKIRLLLAVNGSVERDGTRRRYGLHVPDWFDDPIDAAGWSYGLTGAQYAQLQRRT